MLLGRFRMVAFANIMLVLQSACMIAIGLMGKSLHEAFSEQSKPYEALVKAMPCFDELVVPELQLLKDNEYARILMNIQLCESIIIVASTVLLVCVLGLFVQIFCCSGCHGCCFSLDNKIVLSLIPLEKPREDPVSRKKNDHDKGVGPATTTQH